MIDGTIYDEDYFEHGIETGKSCYTNYRWMPELTIPMAMSYIDYLRLDRKDTILDFGGSKGFVVKALRLLHRQAWGCDISRYAINCVDLETRAYCLLSDGKIVVPFDRDFDYILAKDVFEHISEEDIIYVLTELRKKSKYLFSVTPLGERDKFVIPAYNLDITHVLAKDKDWWIDKFDEAGWNLVNFSYYVGGIKESWANFKRGNGFFLLE